MASYFFKDEVNILVKKYTQLLNQIQKLQFQQDRGNFPPASQNLAGALPAHYLHPKGGAWEEAGECLPFSGQTSPATPDCKGGSEIECWFVEAWAQLTYQGSNVQGRRESGLSKESGISATVIYSFLNFLTVFISFYRIHSHQKDEPENRLSQQVWASNTLFQ